MITNSLRDMAAIAITTTDGRMIHPEDIKQLCKDSLGLSAATDEQIKDYTGLMEMQAKLQHLSKLMEEHGSKHTALFNNIASLMRAISYKINEYKRNYPRLEPSREIILPPHFLAGHLSAGDALEILMHMLEIYARLPQGNSHIFTPTYERHGNTFKSTPFSPCSADDSPLSLGLTLFSAEKRDTSRLQAELNMLGIPADIVRSATDRFRHGDSIVGGVQIVFKCVDPLIFNIAIEVLRIRAQFAPQSLLRDIPQQEPSVLRSSLLSSSLFLRDSDVDQNPNPSSSSSSSSRFGKKG